LGVGLAVSSHAPYSGNGLYYYRNIQSAGNFDIQYTSTGAFSAYNGITTSDCNVNIASLYASGKAFNFIGGASRWQDVAGFTYLTANNVGIGVTASSTAKFEVNGLVSATSAIVYGGATITGAVSASSVSATNISATLIQVGPSSATCSSAVSGSIRYGAASNTLQICTLTGWLSLSSGTANATVGGTTTQLQYSNAGTLAGANLYYISATSSLGVSRSTPVANLDVLGTISSSDAIQVSGSSLTCSSAIKGAIRYSNTSSTIEYCNSTAWTSLGPSATTVPASSVNRNSSNQSIAASPHVKLAWTTRDFDTNSNFANDKFTPPSQANTSSPWWLPAAMEAGARWRSTRTGRRMTTAPTRAVVRWFRT
jgi:hypothetical protein